MPPLRIPLTLAALALSVAGLWATLVVSDTAFGASSTGTALCLALLISLGQLAWYRQRLWLSQCLLVPSLMVMLMILSGYLLPVPWLSAPLFDQPLALATSPPRWGFSPPSLLDTLLLTCLSLSLLLRTRASLGAPLMHALAALVWSMLAYLQWWPGAMNPLAPLAGPWLLAVAALLLVTQVVTVVTGWRNALPSVLRGLGPACLIAGIATGVWYLQESEANHQLMDRAQRESDRLAQQITSRINEKLLAARRLRLDWELDGALPDPLRWQAQTQAFLADFPNLAFIALAGPEGRLRRFQSTGHTGLDRDAARHVGLLMPDAQDSATSPRESASAVLTLPDGARGIISFLPVMSSSSHQPLGTIWLAFDLDRLTTQVMPAEARDGRVWQATLWSDKRPVWRLPGPDIEGPWSVSSTVRLLTHPLRLEIRPSHALLSQLKLHYPAASLCAGFIVAWLLYQLLYSRHQQRQQHHQIADTNTELRREMRRRSRLQKNIEWLADHDDLTGLLNRRKFLASLPKSASQQPLSLLLCDLDHFKSINDQQGHQAGDRALKRFAETVRRQLPEDGLAARYGGEEFVIYLPQGDAAKAREWAESLREAVQSSGIQHVDGRPLTVCIGLITQAQGSVAPKDLLHQADLALYRAKRRGRNRVEEAPAAPEGAVQSTDLYAEPGG
ncbi:MULTISPECIES: sensor domain-containing diguanylate cyclase [unclassified Halomonas]|uniref:GGDEF domain-containing protein n=1 Tax=unclassified Halomonas TaxID=2609666 RepID=UPI001C97D167|nr:MULTISPECIES: GGDEF domain-containing protein [unclassified Halomonas]MBY5923792.1 GGDEF domain-containing protein [Halomonas sp. DP4Y7-2]MBY6230834.1 GGDEF domain-containing protein [Halomonas sp. DP4Y7-1]